jgi:hypothetical protein
MPHFEVRNHTPFAYESLVLSDENGVPQFVTLVQASFSIGAAGVLSLLEEQPALNLGGEWHGDPANASLRLEPQMAFVKLGTDVVLLGHAHAPSPGATEVTVGIRVGPVSKVARVVGDRVVVRKGGAMAVSAPHAFEKIPLVYERAFGGWDRRDADPAQHRCEVRNPVGVGFRANGLGRDDEIRLPNVEDAERPWRGYGDTPPPTGFGFLAPNWQPRLGFAGTYDAAWDRQRKPLLPTDFDRRFFNAASTGLVAPQPLQGIEPVVVIGASPEGRVTFELPGVPPPACVVVLRGRKSVSTCTGLDTVVTDMDRRTLTLIWRGHVPVRNGPHDVLSIDVQTGAWG